MTASYMPANEVNAPSYQAWLGFDEPEEWERFSREAGDSQHWESHIVIDSMHCAACAFNVERALKAISGVKRADVNAISKRAKVIWSSAETKPSQWMFALSEAGYSPLPANEISLLDDRKKAQRQMLWRLLVAGFCMMQVMMYAYPSYISGNSDIPSDIINLLRWASWILSLPVLIFSSSPFFKNAYQDIRNKQISMDLPVALGILITFVVSTAATFSPRGWWGAETYFDSLTMFVFFLLCGRWLELKMRDRTAGALDVLMRRIPQTVQRILQDGSVERVLSTKLKKGDILRVLPGESFPADGVITAGETDVDEALLTGESNPVRKSIRSHVIAGSHNLMAVVEMRVEKVGADTRYAEMVALMESASIQKPRLAALADRIARPFLLFVICTAVLTAALLWTEDHGRALMAAVAVLIVTCPCALSLATPAAMLTISGALAKQGVLVKKLQSLEIFSMVDTLIFDKTGTLTGDQMLMTDVSVSAAFDREQALKIASGLASYSLHPVSKAIVVAAIQTSVNNSSFPLTDVQEVAGSGLTGRSSLGQLKLGSASFCGLDVEFEHYHANVHLVAESGWIASFVFEELPKPMVIETIRALKELGVDVHLVSGDGEAKVKRFAKKVGIDIVSGQCTPQDKLAHMQSLQLQQRTVAMVGDGLNDGPILAMANASVAVGQGVPLAQAQADVIVMNSEIPMVLSLILAAKRTMVIIKQNLAWTFFYNLLSIPLAVSGYMPAWLAGLGMALSSLLVVVNALRLSRLNYSLV